MSTLDWLTLLAWEFLASVLVGRWLGRLRDRRLNRLAARLLIRAPMSTTLPTTTELSTPDWLEDA